MTRGLTYSPGISQQLSTDTPPDDSLHAIYPFKELIPKKSRDKKQKHGEIHGIISRDAHSKSETSFWVSSWS